MPDSYIMLPRCHDGTSGLPIRFVSPDTLPPDTCCPITLDPIAVNPDTLLGVCISPSVGPLAAHPRLTAAVLSCSHAFNAMALMVHFARNGIRCPLCRAGNASMPRLDLLATFPSEPWVHALLPSLYPHHPIPTSNQPHLPVYATFLLFASEPVDHRCTPIMATRCHLQPLRHASVLSYLLPAPFARFLTNHMQDLNIVYLSVQVHVAYGDLRLQIAQMPLTPYPITSIIVFPPSERFSFQTNSGQDPDLFAFVYTPSISTLLSLLAV